MEIGNSFYRNMDFVQASEMYAGALKHVSEPNAPKHDSVDVVALLLLNFSRAMRKLGKLEEGKLTLDVTAYDFVGFELLTRGYQI